MGQERNLFTRRDTKRERERERKRSRTLDQKTREKEDALARPTVTIQLSHLGSTLNRLNYSVVVVVVVGIVRIVIPWFEGNSHRNTCQGQFFTQRTTSPGQPYGVPRTKIRSNSYFETLWYRFHHVHDDVVVGWCHIILQQLFNYSMKFCCCCIPVPVL